MTPLAILPGMGYDPFIHCWQATDMVLHGGFLMRSVGRLTPRRLPALNAAESPSCVQGVRSRRDDESMPMKSGHRKSDRPFDTRVRAVQPVSEGLKMPSRQVVRQTGCADGIAAPRVRWGVLMDGLASIAGIEGLGILRTYAVGSHRPVGHPSKHLGGARKPVNGFHPWGNYV